MRLLIIEDSQKLARSLEMALTNEGYSIVIAPDGDSGSELLQASRFDLVLLDLMLPGIDGFALLKARSKENRDTPVLVMSALADPASKVRALDLSADDYVVKPFDLDEIFARIRALLRRNVTDRSAIMEYEELSIDTTTRKVSVAEQLVALGKLEYDLLLLLMRRRGHSYTKNLLLDILYDGGEDVCSNVIEALVFSLRSKLKKASEREYLKSKRGFGYYIE